MREIKFRVWITETPIEKSWMHYCDIDSFDTINGSKNIMLYTWLQDSYWKDIYEWDIIRILYTDWKSPEFAIETLKNLPLDEYKKKISSVWLVTFYADNYAEYWLDMKWYSEQIYEWTHWEKEVIGNIYENPEIFEAI